MQCRRYYLLLKTENGINIQGDESAGTDKYDKPDR
jgi:hypothetical protein